MAARAMAVVLQAMRPQESQTLPSRWLWVGGAGLFLLLLAGIGLSLWVSPTWKGALLSLLWAGALGGGLYGGWRLYSSVRTYRQTVQLQAREEILRIEGRYKALVQYASEVFCILDSGGVIQYASPSAQRTLGYPPTHLEGSPLRELLHPEDRALVESALARQGSAFFLVRLQHREGYWRYFEAVGQPLFTDPLVKGYLLTLRDVTDRQREEAQKREKEAAALRLAVERERAEYEKNLIEQSKRQLEEAYRIIEEKNREITESIQYAARIQQGMVVPPSVIREYLPESFVFWKPRDIVSGDFYWFLALEEWIYFAAADCTGHGVPGALMTMIASAVLTQAVLQEGLRSPDEILAGAHRLMRRALRQDVPGARSEDGMDIALMAYHPATRRIHYAGANRPLWIVLPGEAELQEYPADRKGIGGASAPAQQFFTLHVVEPPVGAWVYASSDGYADQFGGPQRKKYMAKRFKRFLAQLATLSSEAQLQALEADLAAWKGDYPQTDDILVVGLRA
ncbi:MAG: PAS domain S-box protein [Bacteroidetes bacterium]|nr:MAG: PAS domain S-box protein [Bacteroidota bacterium]